MDLLQTSQGLADWRWQDWVYAVISMGLCVYMFFVSPKLYPKVLARFERKHNLRITSSTRSLDVKGPYHWLYLLWLELKLMLTLMMVYFFPLVAIGLLGYVLGVFTS